MTNIAWWVLGIGALVIALVKLIDYIEYKWRNRK